MNRAQRRAAGNPRAAAEFADRELAPRCGPGLVKTGSPSRRWRSLGDGLHGLCVLERSGGGAGRTLLRAADRGDQPRRRWCRRDARCPHERGYAPDRDGGRGPEGAVGAGSCSGKQGRVLALTEPTTGSDASAIQTTAERVEGGYRLSGHKQWVTNGRVAGSMISSPAPPGRDGFRSLHGRRRRLVWQARAEDGRHLRHYRRRALDNVFVPEEDRLCPRARGFP